MKPKPRPPILLLRSQEASRWTPISHTESSVLPCVSTAALDRACSNPSTSVACPKSIYERCLSHELDRAEIPHTCQAPLSVNYDGVDLPCAYRADIIVHDQVVLEIKSVDRLGPLHEAQLLTYLRLSGCRIGLLLNFNTVSLTDGLRRCVL